MPLVSLWKINCKMLQISSLTDWLTQFWTEVGILKWTVTKLISSLTKYYVKALRDSVKVAQQFYFLHYILPKKFTLQIYYSPNADIWWFRTQCKHSYNALGEGIYTISSVVIGSFFLPQLHSLTMTTNTVMFLRSHPGRPCGHFPLWKCVYCGSPSTSAVHM